MTTPCCPHPVERHAYNGCANCGCAVTWTEHPDRAKDMSIEGLMALGVDPKGPRIRLLVLAKTLERVVRHIRPEVLFVDRGGEPTGVTTTTGEIQKVVREIRDVAEKVEQPRTECPVCEFGQPCPVDKAPDGRLIARWSCGHWLHVTPSEVRR